MSEIIQYLEKKETKEHFSTLLPSTLSVDSFVSIAKNQFTKNPQLALCSTNSLVESINLVAELGIAPSANLVHLIPYKNKCSVIIDYKGLVEIINSDPEVDIVHALTIHENDEFTHSMGEVINHTWNFGGDRGEIIGAYAYIKKTNGTKIFEMMNTQEIEAIRNESNAYKCADNKSETIWHKHKAEMFKKTAVRRLTKWVKLSFRTMQSIEKVDESDFSSYQEKPKKDLFSQPVAETSANQDIIDVESVETPMATADQVRQLNEIFEAKQVDARKIRESLAKKGVTDITELTYSQAQAWINKAN